jgi:ApaG protein
MSAHRPSLLTHGVRITVQTIFLDEQSSAVGNRFSFAYQVAIQNESVYTIQLLRRHWNIYDALATRRVVIGDGVVGLQPILEPGEAHVYASGCVLPTSVGKMEGHYIMQRVDTGHEFPVRIPSFTLVAPFRLN